LNPKYIPIFNTISDFERKYEKIINILRLGDSVKILKYFSQNFTDKQIQVLFNDEIIFLNTSFDDSLLKEVSEVNKILAIDYKTYMVDDILAKVDRATMSVSLEGREPLLDYRIIEYLAQLSPELKYKNSIKKYLLKKITHKYLPENLMNRSKMGFSVPIVEWFTEELKEYFFKYLNKERLDNEGFFNANEVIKLRDNYFQGNKQNINRLWFILMFEMWYERWI
jgi:asparagine synthase (glutamine-hydrolysing)